MKYNFNKKIDRHLTSSVKWDFSQQYLGRDVEFPLWVADMDFRSAQEITSALSKRVNHGLFGITGISPRIKSIVKEWVKTQYHWDIQEQWICFVPSVTTVISIAVQTCTKEGDTIIYQPPVYSALFKIVENNKRKSIANPLIVDKSGTYRMDFDHLESLCKNHSPRMIILCNPHNPVGRAWDVEELTNIVALANKYGFYIVSDEIFADIIFPPFVFTSLGTIQDAVEAPSIVCFSPSKSFNIAGMNLALAIIPHEETRHQIEHALQALSLTGQSTFGLVTMEAAYSKGTDWLTQLIPYLKENISTVSSCLSQQIPEIKPIIPDATFMMWLDFSRYQHDTDFLANILIKQGSVALSEGSLYGDGGRQFMRMNVATPRRFLVNAIYRIKTSLSKI